MPKTSRIPARKRGTGAAVPPGDASGIRMPERAQVAPAEAPPPGVAGPSAWGPVVVLLLILAAVIWAGYLVGAARG